PPGPRRASAASSTARRSAPVGVLEAGRLGVQRRDRRLDGETPGVLAAGGLLHQGQAFGDQVRIPSAAVLVLERDRDAVGILAGGGAGLGQQQQRQQPLRFRGRRQQLPGDPRQADR